MRLYASIKIKEEYTRDTVFELRNIEIEKAFRDTVIFVNRKYQADFTNKIKNVFSNIRRKIKNG